MNAMPPEQREGAAGLGEVHRLGAAGESLFSRLYRSLNRRRQLEDDLRQQLSEASARQEDMQRQMERLRGKQRQRGDELARLEAVLGSLDDGIIVQDTNGKVTMMNGAAEAMLGGKRAFWDSALGTLFEQHRAVQETVADLTPLAESDELALNNRILRAQLIAIGDEGGRRIGTVIILRDVTYDALAERLKHGFVSYIAEDMERPVGVIKLASELMSAQPEDAAVNRRLLEKLAQNVDLLDQLSLELLDIARLNAGAFDVAREPVDVETVIWSVVNGIEEEVKSRGVDLLVMTRGLSGVLLRGDATRLQWALGHLIRNGAEFNAEGGYVALAARPETRNRKRYALISVSDNGTGIRGEDLPHIFERFYRGETASENQRQGASRGLGQGLYVARAICEAHGGYLRVQSRERVGSIFTMAVPVYAEPANENA